MAEKRDQKHVSISSLVGISISYILAANDIKPLDYVPTYIIQRIQTSASQNNACESCRLPFFNPSVKVIHWRDTLGNTQVPFLYRFCSTSCCNKMFWLLLFFIFLCTYCFLSFDYSLYSIATDLFFFFILFFISSNLIFFHKTSKALKKGGPETKILKTDWIYIHPSQWLARVLFTSFWTDVMVHKDRRM
jgi:hypothetical protein